MNGVRFERMLIAANVILAALAVTHWRAAVIVPPAIQTVPPGLHRHPVNVIFSEDSLSDAADDIASGDPFRVANEPTNVPFKPVADGGGSSQTAPTPTVHAPRPALVLRAIVGGPPWQAILDGIPGQPAGTIVTAGMLISELRIRSVSRDTVMVQGSDTTWRLTLGKAQP